MRLKSGPQGRPLAITQPLRVPVLLRMLRMSRSVDLPASMRTLTGSAGASALASKPCRLQIGSPNNAARWSRLTHNISYIYLQPAAL